VSGATVPRADRADELAMRLARRTAPLLGVGLLLGCAAEPAAPRALCEALLESKRPGAAVVASLADGDGRLALAYALPDGGPEGILTCEVEGSALGGPRLRAARLDGRPLSDTELVVRNANLLLDDLYALGGGRG
jgi:hypothetical protein